MNIRVDLNYPIQDGTEAVFRSPVDCSQITGLKVYYPENGIQASKEFALADAHGNNVGDIDHLFAENVVVKVILDVTTGMAFVQNADTNAYIEKTFIKSVNGTTPDENGNVQIYVGGGLAEGAVLYTKQKLSEAEQAQARENIGAVTDDSAVSEKPWSSKNAVDKLCPTFTESGAVVTCEPVEGTPLGVVSKIEPVQPEGVPSLTNICPITGHTSATLLHQDTEFTVDFGQVVYGASLNWNTGELTVNMVQMLLNGKENWSDAHYSNVVTLTGIPAETGAKVLSNIFQYADTPPGTNVRTGKIYVYGNIHIGYKSVAEDLASFKTFLADQYNAGTPVQLCYTLKTPITIKLTPQEIIALPGTNTLHSSTGDTEVTGKAYPTAIIEKLTNAIIALGGNV